MMRRPWFPFLLLLLLAGTPGVTLGQDPPDRTRGDTLTLAEAVAAALEHHPIVGVARERTIGAEAELRAARAARLPSLTLQGEAVRYELPMVVAPLHGFDPSSPPAFDRTLIRSRIGASWTVFDGGAARASVESREALRDARSAGVEEAEIELIEHTTQAYLEVVVLRKVVEAGTERIAALEAELDRVRRHLAEGRAAEVERLRAEAGLREAEAETASAEARLRAKEGALARLIARTPAEVSLLRVHLPAHSSSRAGETDSESPPSPAIVAARERVRAEEAAVRAVRSDRLPRAEIVGGVSQFGGAASSTTAEWDAGLRLSWHLFTGGRRAGMEEGAKARLRQAGEELRVLELRLSDTADGARAALEGAEARREALHAAAEAHAEVARIEALALDAGSGTQRDLLDAEASLFEARSAHARAEAEVVAAHVRIAAVTGALGLGWVLDNLEVNP
jgi:outer membrane protein TolC